MSTIKECLTDKFGASLLSFSNLQRSTITKGTKAIYFKIIFWGWVGGGGGITSSIPWEGTNGKLSSALIHLLAYIYKNCLKEWLVKGSGKLKKAPCKNCKRKIVLVDPFFFSTHASNAH